MADDRVVITLPTGERASVPASQLDQALAVPGTHLQTDAEQTQQQYGGLLGQSSSALVGVARGGTLGLFDPAFAGAAELVGGDTERKAMLRGLNTLREANPYASMGGEAAGLLLGAEATGLGAAGAGIEGGVTGLLGEGLAGRALGMGARGAFESGAIGAGHQISEDTLGDHATTAAHLFAAMGKDALLGGGAGAALGAASHVGGEAYGLLRKPPGPIPNRVLDEVIGAPGAGRPAVTQAGIDEGLISNLQKSGATSEQAARMADEVKTMANARTSAGAFDGAVDGATEEYIARRAGKNAQMAEDLRQGYAEHSGIIAKHDERVAEHALALKKASDDVMRELRDTIDEAQFKQKPEHFAKLVDASSYGAQRDMANALMQEADYVLDFWEGTAAKGGAEGAIKTLRKQLTDFQTFNAKLGEDGNAFDSRNIYMRLEKMKQGMDRLSQYGRSPYGLPEAVMHDEMGLRTLGNKLRSALEDSDVWGAAGNAQKEWNGTFSGAQSRVSDFDKRFTNTIDSASGIPLRSGDAGKFFESLSRLDNPAKSFEDVKTMEATIAGFRDRVAAIEKYADLAPGQSAKIARGKKALDTLESKYAEARQEAGVVGRLRQQQLEEQSKSLGGVVGLVADIVTRPLKTVERLAAIRQTAARAEKAIADGIAQIFDGGATPVATAPRPRTIVMKEMQQVRSLAANPEALQARIASSLGDMAQHAPKLAQALTLQTMRAVMWLANEAPKPRTSFSVFSPATDLRASDQELTEWERKRAGAFNPQDVIREMKEGKLNHDGIRAVKFVSPPIFAQMQDLARQQIQRLAQDGKLSAMPLQTQAAIATLLETPPNGTWEPDFVLMMQAAKAQPAAQPTSAGAPAPRGPKKPIKIEPSIFQTAAQQVEGRTHG